MLKILKGNVKFYPGLKLRLGSPIEAPDLNSIPGDSPRGNSSSSSNALNILENDATIDTETKNEIMQIMPHIDDPAKS